MYSANGQVTAPLIGPCLLINFASLTAHQLQKPVWLQQQATQTAMSTSQHLVEPLVSAYRKLSCNPSMYVAFCMVFEVI